MRTRARRIAVRVSEEQYNKISRLTERSFFTKEQVLRDIILGYPIQEDRKLSAVRRDIFSYNHNLYISPTIKIGIFYQTNYIIIRVKLHWGINVV